MKWRATVAPELSHSCSDAPRRPTSFRKPLTKKRKRTNGSLRSRSPWSMSRPCRKAAEPADAPAAPEIRQRQNGVGGLKPTPNFVFAVGTKDAIAVEYETNYPPEHLRRYDAIH